MHLPYYVKSSSWHWGPWNKPHISHLPFFRKSRSYVMLSACCSKPSDPWASLWVLGPVVRSYFLLKPLRPFPSLWSPFRRVREPAHTASQEPIVYFLNCTIWSISCWQLEMNHCGRILKHGNWQMLPVRALLYSRPVKYLQPSLSPSAHFLRGRLLKMFIRKLTLNFQFCTSFKSI